jgi:pimeloyl-ACP methyl ester carboxylesterase
LTKLLLLHGALGAKSQFSALTPLLEPHFQVHTLDFEGHGMTGQTDRPFKIEYFAENVLTYLETQAIEKNEKIDVFGYSMGGYVALYLALMQPERIQIGKIFTLATKLDWTPATAEKEVGMLDADKILQKIPRYAQALQELHEASDWRVVLEKTKRLLLGLGQQNLLTPEALAQISNPVRLTLGDKDVMVSFEETVAAYRVMRLGELQIFPATPHPLDKISPVLLAEAIIHFFVAENLVG